MLWFFFFKQKTAYEMRISDGSSDVCSSDLDDQVSDRRLFEVSLNDSPPPPAPLPQVAVLDGAPVSQVEAPGNTIAFNISLSEAATEDVIVSFSTVNGTATAGSDFVGVSGGQATIERSEEHTSELQSLIRISYAVFCLHTQ